MIYSEATHELWIGDKKGTINILNAEDFTLKQTIEKKHNHAISYMAVSKLGKLVASGDGYRYIYVFNAETKEEVGCYAYHTSKIIHLEFNSDASMLVTSSLDLNVGIINIGAKTKKVISSKTLNKCIIYK